MDVKRMGLTLNEGVYIGRVINNPEIQGEWARLQLMTLVPEKTNDGWSEQECIVPMITNNPRTIQTLQQYVQAERQLMVKGYVKSWTNAAGALESAIFITTVKLGSKTIYVPNDQAGGQAGGQMGGQAGGQMGGQMGGQPGGQMGGNPF